MRDEELLGALERLVARAAERVGAEGGDPNAWATYRRLVVDELAALRADVVKLNGKLDDVVEKINDRILKMHTEIALLKFKSSLWGAAAAVLVTAGLYLVERLRGG